MWISEDMMVQTLARDLEYIVDAKGKKTKVVLPVAVYEKLLEDLHDLSVIAERRDEASMSLAELKARLQVSHGKLSSKG
jgi:hypothetical protein